MLRCQPVLSFIDLFLFFEFPKTDRYVRTSEKKKNEIPSFGFFQISKLRKLRVFPSFEICKKPKLGISSYNTTFFRFFFFRSPHIAIGLNNK